MRSIYDTPLEIDPKMTGGRRRIRALAGGLALATALLAGCDPGGDGGAPKDYNGAPVSIPAGETFYQSNLGDSCGTASEDFSMKPGLSKVRDGDIYYGADAATMPLEGDCTAIAWTSLTD